MLGFLTTANTGVSKMTWCKDLCLLSALVDWGWVFLVSYTNLCNFFMQRQEELVISICLHPPHPRMSPKHAVLSTLQNMFCHFLPSFSLVLILTPRSVLPASLPGPFQDLCLQISFFSVYLVCTTAATPHFSSSSPIHLPCFLPLFLMPIMPPRLFGSVL